MLPLPRADVRETINSRVVECWNVLSESMRLIDSTARDFERLLAD
jgi:hypothetical protein